LAPTDRNALLRKVIATQNGIVAPERPDRSAHGACLPVRAKRARRGDEFAILVPETGREGADQALYAAKRASSNGIAPLV